MSIPVFLNGTPIHAPAGGTLASLLADHAPDLLRALMEGRAVATDGRLVAVRSDAPLTAGAIFLVRVSARAIQDATHA